MRVIAGKFGSRRLRSLRGSALRPTSDRLRETLFDILGPEIEDALFVDAFAGTGAIGIEALSRGARKTIFIEMHPAAVKLIHWNLSSLTITDEAEVLPLDAIRGLEILSRRKLLPDFIFLDPPYRNAEEHERVLDFIDAKRLLAPAGRLIVEHSRRIALPNFLGHLERTRLHEQGDAALSFYRLALAA